MYQEQTRSLFSPDLICRAQYIIIEGGWTCNVRLRSRITRDSDETHGNLLRTNASEYININHEIKLYSTQSGNINSTQQCKFSYLPRVTFCIVNCGWLSTLVVNSGSNRTKYIHSYSTSHFRFWIVRETRDYAFTQSTIALPPALIRQRRATGCATA